MLGLGLAGLALALQAVPLRPARLTLPPDSAAAVQSVKLRDGALHGRVFTVHSEGHVPQIAVRLSRKGAAPSGPMRPVTMTANGAFSLPNVTPGAYVLDVFAAGYAETQLSITAGATGQVDLLVRLSPDPFGLEDACDGNCPELIVRGRVRCRGAGGGVPPGLQVAFVDAAGGPPTKARAVSPDGRFDLKGWRGPDLRIVVLQRDDLIESLPLRAGRDTVRIDPLLLSCVP